MEQAQRRYEETTSDFARKLASCANEWRAELEDARERERTLSLLIEEEASRSKQLEAQMAIFAECLV